ncbi:zinc metalloproteinase nas-15-like isoform X2 [Babylonia areolata]
MRTMYTCVTLLLAATVSMLEGASIDEIIMQAAPKSSALDTFHMSPDGEVMVRMELDIDLTMEEYMELKGRKNVRREKRKALRGTDRRWKNCYVYYEIITGDFSKSDVKVIREAMDQWEKYTCLEFKPAGGNTEDKVVFQRGSGGCYSRLGRVGGVQEIGLSKGCVQRGVVVHEIGHAIGWIHEQARPDRDQYIRVNFNRIPQSWHPQFEKFDDRFINDYDVEYDYRSIMHYSGNAIAPRSIETLDPGFQQVIGQREGLSFRDVMLANLMYSCADMLCSGVNTDCSRYGHDAFLFKRPDDTRCQCFCPASTHQDADVLVPCNSSTTIRPTMTTRPTTTTTPRPTTTTTKLVPTTTTEEPMECEDLRPDCGDLVQAGECKMDMERMFMYCKKSCSFCGKENMCMDYDKSCPLLALGNFCDHPDFQPLMEKQCPKSCQLCTPVDPCQMQLDMGLAVHDSGSGHSRPSSVLGLLILAWALHRLSLLQL